MGWYEWLSGSDQPEGARPASAIEEGEIRRWTADNKKKLDSDESLGWKGCLFTGYHLHKVKKDESTEYLKTNLPSGTAKLNTKINAEE